MPYFFSSTSDPAVSDIPDTTTRAPPSGSDTASSDATTPPVELSDAADAALVGKLILPAGPSTLSPPAPVDPASVDGDGISEKSLMTTSTLPHPDNENSAETADAHSNTADTTSPPHAPPKPQNDEDLPPWLGLMIGYLRGVTEDVAWQDLVTAFVDFEKRGPPNGVSSPIVDEFLLRYLM
jgi:hypothetical protein